MGVMSEPSRHNPAGVVEERRPGLADGRRILCKLEVQVPES
jgi:hypothetical protein